MQLRCDDPQWTAQFNQERGRLLAALGALTEGGIVEHLEHIGATSVPGALARPCVDIGLAVWPFPLEPPHQRVLDVLGYRAVPGYAGASEQRLCHVTGTFRLYVAEAGSEFWTDYLIIREYLRHVESARDLYSRTKRGLAPTGELEAEQYEARTALLFQEMLAAARLWWVDYHGLAPVHLVMDELAEFARPWSISSGWALDLFLGRVTRVHQDVDVVIGYADQLILQAHLTARGWRLFAPLDGRLEPWPVHMQLELPRHQVHALRDDQFIDVLLTDVGHGVWRYRRNPGIIRGVEQMMVRTAEGIPYLAPELVLLYKSRNTSGRERRKDQADFEKVKDVLEPERRAWLRWALMVEDPNHPWLAALV